MTLLKAGSSILYIINNSVKQTYLHWYVVATPLAFEPMLKEVQTSTSYLVPGLSTGVVNCLCVAVLCTVLLQTPGDPLDGLSRYLSR